MHLVINTIELANIYNIMKQHIILKTDTFQERDSGWTLTRILYLEVNINEYQPLKGSNYIPLPNKLKSKLACINVQNNDIFCFKWSIISAVNPAVKHSERDSSYNIHDITSDVIQLSNNFTLNFNSLSFPLKIQDISKFEVLNQNISVNVFGWEEDHIVGP